MRFTLQQRAVPVEVTQLRLSAFSSAGVLLKGPETFPKAAELTWRDVPVAATRLQIEYLVGLRVTGLASIPIAIAPGGQIEVRDPDFQTVEASLSSIEVTAASNSFPRGASTQLTATGVFDDNSRRNLSSSVTWTSMPTGVVSINAQGLASGVDPGTTTVRAALGPVSGTLQVQVTAAVLREIQLSRASLNLAAGTQAEVSATGVYSDGSSVPITASVTWRSTVPAVASVSGGRVQGLTTGSAEVVAGLTGIEARLPVTVTAAVLQSVQPSSPSLRLAKGTTSQLSLTGIFSDGSSQPLTPTWASLAPATAAVGSDGTVSALSEGQTSIVATFGSFQVSVPVTITAAEVRGLQVSTPSLLLPLGTSLDVEVTAFFTDGTSQDVTEAATWSSDAPTIASVDKGRVRGLAQGDTVVRVAFGGVQNTVGVRVTTPSLQRVEISSTSVTLAKGTSQNLTLTAFYSDATMVDVSAQATWQAVDPTIVHVSAGQISAVSEGNTQVVATFAGERHTATVTVTAAELRSLQIVPDTRTVAAGTFTDFAVNGTYSDGIIQRLTHTVTWQTTDTSVAHISNTDGSRGRVTGLKQGSTRVNASLNGIQDDATVEVTAAVPVALSITPEGASVGISQEIPLAAHARLSDNSVVEVTNQATWRSLDETRALVVSPGRLRGVALGNVTIEATYGGQASQFNLLVGHGNGYVPTFLLPNGAISRDGRLVAASADVERVPGHRPSVVRDILLYNLDTAATRTVTTTPSGGDSLYGGQEPSVNANADLIAFRSYSPDLVAGDTNNGSDVFVRDMNALGPTLVSVSAQGVQSNGKSWSPRIAADGRFVVFASNATNLVPNDTNNVDDVFVKDLLTGAIERVNISSSGAQANRTSTPANFVAPMFYSTFRDDITDNYLWLAISAEGRFIAFRSEASNLVPDDTNGVADVFVHDRQTHQTQRISVGPGGAQASAESGSPAISADGATVVFIGPSSLVPGGAGSWDVYARDLPGGTVSVVSTTESGTRHVAGLGPVYTITISDDGRFVSFPHSGNLAPDTPGGITTPTINGFVKDRQTGRVWVANRNQSGVPVFTGNHSAYLSGDGNFVFFSAQNVASFLPWAPAGVPGLVRAFNRLAVGP